MAQVLSSLHTLTKERVFLEYGVYEESAAVFCRAHRRIARIIERQLAVAYPDIEIERISDMATAPPVAAVTKT